MALVCIWCGGFSSLQFTKTNPTACGVGPRIRTFLELEQLRIVVKKLRDFAIAVSGAHF